MGSNIMVMQLQLAAAPLCIDADGHGIALAGRDAALLAWLALEGPTPRARMAQLLWPESSAEQARNALRQRLFQLRRQLGADVVSGSTTLALAAGVSHDLHEADAVLGDTPEDDTEFGAWLAQQRQRRRARLRTALVELADMAERAHDHADALVHAQELLALEPLSEEAHRRVMRLHYLAGDRAAALLAFDACERMLKDEVGAVPCAQTMALLATVEGATAAPGPPPLRAAASAGAGVEPDRDLPLRMPARVPASVLRPPRLVGRFDQWQALQDAWDDGRGAIVSGEGGMGKSRLVGDFARASRRTVLACARPGDERVVYASFSRLLRALPVQAVRELAAPLRKELARLLPELGDAPALRGEADRARFFNAVSAALASEALALEGIVFDDLHFADDASIELLRYVLGAGGRRWLLAARQAELSPTARTWLDELVARADAVPVPLPPLTLAQVAELTDSLGIATLDGAAAAPALLRRTGGNPLYLLETVKAWLGRAGMPGEAGGERGVPEPPHAASRHEGGTALQPLHLPMAGSVHALIERRIGRLSSAAVQLARCAAVASPDFSIELASRVLGLRTLDLADPWAELEAAQVFRDGAFAHDLIQESALASVPEPVARQLHAEIAAFLQEQGGEPARLAQHWVQARQWAAAGAALRAAAERARDASRLVEQAAALAEAAACFERARLPGERFDALLLRARILATNDAGAEAAAAVAAVEGAAAGELQRLLALEARFELANARSEIDVALQRGRQAIADARALGHADLELRLAILLAGALSDARQAAEALVLLEPFAPWVRQHASDEVQWEYWEATALALDYADRLHDALPVWEEARAVAQRAARRDMLWTTMANSAGTQAKMGRVQQAAQAGEQARALAVAAGEVVSMRMRQMHVTQARRLRDLGRYGEALPLLEDALASYASEGASPGDLAVAEHQLAILFQQLGQPARAQPLLAPPRPGLTRGSTMIRLAQRALLEQVLGRDGLPLVREALQIIPNTDDIYHRITSLFATSLVPADEGEAMAASLAAWATTRERHGVALAGHVRAAACALALGAARRAAPHVEAALHLARSYQPDSFYLPEMWLVAARVWQALGRPDAALAAADGRAWVMATHASHVPEAFGDSFLQRNAVNAELLAWTTLPGA
jgi:DNA-binding SARP family transcriptional activator